MKQGNNISSPSNCNCVNLQLHLLSLPNSRFSDSWRTSIMFIMAFIALVASFSLKNLPISEKNVCTFVVEHRAFVSFCLHFKVKKIRDIRKSLYSFLCPYFIQF